MSHVRILVVDDDTSLRRFLTITLKRNGWDVEAVASGRAAITALERQPADLVVTDLMMEDLDGMAVLDAVRERWPDTQVVMVTAHATAQNAVEAMKRGAFDYLLKPFNVDELLITLRKALALRQLSAENRNLKALLKDRYGYASMIGKSPAMQAIYELMDRVKDTPINVLLTGESGTGKELAARAIHFEGQRRERPFRSINCGAIPDNLIESELFGYKKGAFTGAARDHDGLFAAAEGGTLFLDEVGEMPLPTQVKVLRAIQERKIKPVGGVEEQPVDVRIVAATNRDLAQQVEAGAFREDLYYRLNVVSITLPPLRDRLGDLPLLVQHFIEHYAAEFGREGMFISESTMRRMAGHDWPGNVRELENAIQRGVALSRGQEVTLDSLPPSMSGEFRAVRGAAQQLLTEGALVPTTAPPEGVELEPLIEGYERLLVEGALERSGGVKKEAARLLGVSFRSLRYRLQKLGLD